MDRLLSDGPRLLGKPLFSPNRPLTRRFKTSPATRAQTTSCLRALSYALSIDWVGREVSGGGLPALRNTTKHVLLLHEDVTNEHTLVIKCSCKQVIAQQAPQQDHTQADVLVYLGPGVCMTKQRIGLRALSRAERHTSPIGTGPWAPPHPALTGLARRATQYISSVGAYF